MTSSSVVGYTEVTIRYTSGNSSSRSFNTYVPKPEPVPKHTDVLLNTGQNERKHDCDHLTEAYLLPWSE